MSTTLQFKASLDSNSKPIVQALIDENLFKMKKEDRLDLGSGPTFKLKLGENITIHEEVPKRAAMAFSKAFNDQLSKHPGASAFMLNPLQVSEASVAALVDFIVGNSKTNKPFSLPTQGLQLSEAIGLYHHGLIFGMERHVAALRAAILGQVNDDKGPIISYGALNELVRLPVHDRIYQAIVRKLEGLVHIKALDDDPEWPVWLKKNGMFRIEMENWKAIREERAQKNRFDRNFPTLGKNA